MKKSLLALTIAGSLAALFYLSMPAPDGPAASTHPGAPARMPLTSAPEQIAESSGQSADFGADALKAAKAPDFKPLHAFRDWEQRYLAAATAEERAAMAAEGAALAKVRRPEMKKLIVQIPQLALELAVRPVVSQDLPAEVVAELEKPVSKRGDFKAYFGRPQEGVALPEDSELVLRYFETAEGDSFKARVFGSMQEAVSRKDVPFRGVAIDRELAVAENPVRQLEAGERIAAGTRIDETCPVSNITTPTSTETPIEVEPETPLVELGGHLIRLCNGTHVRVFGESQLWASGGPGGAGNFLDTHPGTSSEAIGNFRCLYIRVTYPDQMRAPNTEGSAYSDMRNVSRFYLESSYGKLTTTTSVTPLIVMPHTKAWYIAKDSEVDGLGLVHSDARAEARKLGYDSGQFNCTIVRVNEGPRLSGISWGGGDSVWVSWDGMDVLNHECGHSIGRNHANFWNTSDGSAIGVGANQEYGNSFDVMGGGGGFGAHYNSYSKRSLGWLQDNYIHRPGTTPNYNGIYRIYAYDQPRVEEGKRYSLRVDKDAQRRFYFEYHPAIGGSWPNQMLMLMSGLGSNAGHLVDTTPGSAGGKGDGGIQIGRTFSDFESDMHFTVLSKNGTTPESLDMAMMRGPFPGNLPPVVSLAATATTVAVNGSVTFTATASDPNGDTLAYHWDFSDGYVATNSSSITRSFTTGDQQTIELTVSDLKGGTARAHTYLTIGNPGRVMMSGRITAGGQPLKGVLVTSDTDKYCFTDTNGDYVLADLQTGSRTLTASFTGYTFTPGFTNPLNATPAGTAPTVTGLNWTADSVTEVTMTATDAAEGGANGSFVITRTGDTSAALDVTASPAGGSAVKTTDYTFSPDYTASGSMNTFTIPAGQASLTVTVAAVNDTAQEGPETVSLQLAAGGYQVRTSGLASLTIADNDTTKPVVSVEAADIYATEAAGDTGTFRVSRTGTAALTVSLTYSGTATNGTDYTSPPATVTIPAGQPSALVTLTAVDDTAIETPEDATVTVATNANYIVSTNTSAATVTITDNDMATVNVTALDDTLNEAGRGTGLVVISRTGSLAAPLTVYYGLSGRALHGTDYAALPGQVTFPAGVESVPVFLTPYDDGQGEADESITFNLALYDNSYTLGPNFTATLNIKDNADAPLVTVIANSAAEPSTNGTFTFTAFGAVSGNITVSYSISGTATGGTDFTMPGGTVSIAGTSTDSKGVSATVSIPVLNDTLPENTETIILTINPGAGYTVYNDGQATMRLKDDDSEPVAVSTHSSGLAEPADESSFYISRSGSTGDLAVSYTMSGTATNGTDYTLLSGSAVIADGTTGVDVTVTPIEDTLKEGTESVIMTLNTGAGYGLEVPQATLYLQDNDLPSTLASMGFTSATGTTTETPDATTGEYRDIPVTLPSAMTGTVTVDYVASGGTATGDDIDWSFADAASGNALISRGTLTFPPGTTSRDVRIRVRNDGVIEGSETIFIDLVNLNVGGSSTRLSSSRYRHTLTVTDNTTANPVPRVSFLTAATTRQEADGTEPLLIAALDTASASTVTVNYTLGGTAAAGSDYTLAPGTLTFAAGETFKKLPLVLISDGVTELSETIIVTLGSPSGAVLGSIPAHTITLADVNTAAVSVTASAANVEEDSSQIGVFTITRAGGAIGLPLTVSYTVSGTASAGVDYNTLSGTVTLAANQLSTTRNITPVPDTDQESDETVVVTINDTADYNPGATPEATVTILDDDAAPVITFVSPTASSVAIPQGVGLLAEVNATRELPAGTSLAPVTWSTVSGPGTVTFESPANRRTAVTFGSTGTYVLRASSTHGVTVDADVTVTVVSAAIAQTFAATRLGNAPAGTGFTYTTGTGTYNLTTGGSSIPSSGTADQFLFAQQAITGDCSITARVVSIATGGSNTSDNRTGVMIRENLSSGGSPHAFVGITKTPATRFISRDVAAAASTNTSGTGAFPLWVRLVRSGNVFTGETAPDVNGTPGTWTQLGTRTIALPSAAFIGIAGASGSSSGNTTAAAVVDNVRILPHAPVSNLGPSVDAGLALSGAGPWNLDATVSDDNQPAPASLSTNWLSVSGPATATFQNAGAVDTGVFFPASGSYRLRLTADDGQVRTFDDTTANISTQTPIEAWRAARFGANATNPAIAGDLVDFEKDGLTNLVEYALASDPQSSVPADLPVSTTDGASITYTYRLNLDATDISVQLQASPDMTNWSIAPATLTTLSDDGHVRVIQATIPAEVNRRFIRLNVTYFPPVNPWRKE